MDYHSERIEAEQTLELSARTARRFIVQLGALNPILIPPFPSALLGKRPGTHATVTDHRYWFAKLYELVTYQELRHCVQTKYPGFTLHFVKAFYSRYFSALENFDNKVFGQVIPLWMTHFLGPKTEFRKKVDPCSEEAVRFSVRTGAIAHIQGDLPLALVTAYKSWSATPKPPFEALKDDFILGSERAFIAAQASFYIEVNDKIASPFRPEVGQLGAAYYQAIFGIQPTLPLISQWRREAWQRAANSL